MAAPNLATINGLLFARLKSDAAGAAVRAALGAGAASVIPATHLRREPRPARVLLVWRGSSVGGQSGGMRDIIGTWWIYDDPAQGFARIDALIPLMEAAYPLDVIDPGETRITLIGQQGESAVLGGLRERFVQLTYRRLS
jgi:hypothetical protein